MKNTFVDNSESISHRSHKYIYKFKLSNGKYRYVYNDGSRPKGSGKHYVSTGKKENGYDVYTHGKRDTLYVNEKSNKLLDDKMVVTNRISTSYTKPTTYTSTYYSVGKLHRATDAAVEKGKNFVNKVKKNASDKLKVASYEIEIAKKKIAKMLGR